MIEKFADLLGHVLRSVVRSEGRDGDELLITLEDGRKFALLHHQDCCESVSIEDIAGDLTDLVGEVVLAAEESNGGIDAGGYDHETWTFYRLGTAKGTCVIRWYGSSNGYYSESVDFEARK